MTESQYLKFKPVVESPSLVSRSVFELGNKLKGREILVAEIDPQFMGGKELCEHYGVDPNEGANCVIVEAVKGNISDFVAIVIPVGYRADLNGFVKKYLNARRVSLAPLEKVLEITGMEYGSITPFGLPSSWKVLIEKSLMEQEKIIVGGGKQISKLLLPTSVFYELSNTEVLEGLSKRIV